MGTSLTGLTPATTYDALIKVGDNGPLSATAKVLSDGLGNDSPLAMSTTQVGIGNSSPAATLDVASRFLASSNDGNAEVVLASTSNRSPLLYFKEGSTQRGLIYSAAGSNNLIFQSGTTEAMRITSAGNVGIGTTSPSAKLTVVGTGEYDGLLIVRSTGSNTPQAALGVDAVGSGVGYVGTVNNIPLQIRTNDVTRLRVDADGLKFGSDTAAANALDDYEEGTWTPVLRGSSTAGTYELSSAVAAYTKIGRQVTVNAQILTAGSVTGGGSGYLQITGLPFTNSSQSVGNIFVSGIDFSGNYLTVQFISSSGQSIVYLGEISDNAPTTDFPVSAVGANDTFNFTITYFA
jgi:hypothetical protein